MNRMVLLSQIPQGPGSFIFSQGPAGTVAGYFQWDCMFELLHAIGASKEWHSSIQTLEQQCERKNNYSAYTLKVQCFPPKAYDIIILLAYILEARSSQRSGKNLLHKVWRHFTTPFFPRPLWGQEVLSDEFCMEFRQGSSFGYDLDDLTRLTTNQLNDISTRTYIPQKRHLVNWYLYSIIQYCIVLYTYILYIIYILYTSRWHHDFLGQAA
jgi:hypothetical protein